MDIMDFLRYRTNGDKPNVNTRLFDQVTDTLSTADRTRGGITTPADSVYSIIVKYATLAQQNAAKDQAKAQMRNALALHESGMSPGETGLLQSDMQRPDLAFVKGDIRRAEDNPSMYEYIHYYSPDLRRQLLQKLLSMEGRASGGILRLLR